jgi:trigger factor
MQIEIQEIDYCRLNVQCEAETKQVEDKRFEIAQYFRNSKVPGFRPGKATLDAIRSHYRSKIDELTKSELSQAAFHAAIAEKNIRPFGKPQFSSIVLDGNKFKCDFAVNKIPEVELSEYKGFNLPQGNIPDSVEMAEKILQELRVRNGETVPFSENDFVQEGDSAIVSYMGFVDGQENAVVKMDGEMFVVGRAQVQAFNENVLGMKLGEKREFTIKMPDDSAAQHVAGKEVRFELELNMGSKSTPAPIDDSLAQKVGAKDIAELISTTQGMASSRVQELKKSHLSDQITARLVENHKFEVPGWLSAFEAEMLAKQYGYTWDSLADEQKSRFVSMAEKNVKLSIIFDKIRETEPDAQMTDEEVITSIRANISKYKSTLPGMEGKTDEEVIQVIGQSGYMPALASHIRDDFALDFIIKNSTIIE